MDLHLGYRSYKGDLQFLGNVNGRGFVLNDEGLQHDLDPFWFDDENCLLLIPNKRFHHPRDLYHVDRLVRSFVGRINEIIHAYDTPEDVRDTCRLLLNNI